MKCVFLFYLQISPDTFLTLRRIERDVIKSVSIFIQSLAPILMTLEFSQQIFRKILKCEISF